MNFVSGSLTIIELRISSSPIGVWRQALGFREPFLNAFSATLARALEVIP